MLDFAKKSLFTGLGLAAMTKDKIEQLAKEFADKAKLSEDEGRKLADYLKEESDKARSSLKDTIDGMVEGAMKRLRCAQRIDALEARVARLEEKCGCEAPQESDAAACDSCKEDTSATDTPSK